MTADLKAIRARLAAATPGPWHAWDRGIGYEVHKGAERDCLSEFGTGSEHCDELNDGFRETFARGDADLIAHAPADLAALCDEVEALTARAERAEAAVQRVRELVKDWSSRFGSGIQGVMGRQVVSVDFATDIILRALGGAE